MEEQKGNRDQFGVLAHEEEQIICEYNDRYKSHEYQNSFYPPPSSNWKVDAPFCRRLLRICRSDSAEHHSGSASEDVVGPSGCFLCRHYLELALKYTLFHSRWLKDEQHNAPADEVESVDKKDGHLLLKLWRKLDAEVRSRMPSILASGLDLPYVGEFVKELDRIDPNGERFRYAGQQLVVNPNVVSPPALGIDFDRLLFSLELAHDILGDVDSRLVNQYGENQEWEDEQNSW
jgi:hypothetical protein